MRETVLQKVKLQNLKLQDYPSIAEDYSKVAFLMTKQNDKSEFCSSDLESPFVTASTPACPEHVHTLLGPLSANHSAPGISDPELPLWCV